MHGSSTLPSSTASLHYVSATQCKYQLPLTLMWAVFVTNNITMGHLNTPALSNLTNWSGTAVSKKKLKP